MQNRVVEISSDGAHISLSRGFLCVQINDEKIGQIAIEDMSALIIRGYGASLSVNICEQLAKANVPIVICGSNQSPASVIWPISGHFSQGLHMQAQAVANKPLQKRLWAQLVKSKIKTQSTILETFNLHNSDLSSMARRVKSGDGDNLEAQAARKYWPRLMGSNFKRNQGAGGINGALDYGYTVLRAATARSILAAGLHPSLSIHHQSRGDALRLADDLMEPYRPWVDYQVKIIAKTIDDYHHFDLTKQHKAQLASVLLMDLQSHFGASPLQVCLDRMAQSLVQIYLGQSKTLDLPTKPLALDLASMVER